MLEGSEMDANHYEVLLSLAHTHSLSLSLALSRSLSLALSLSRSLALSLSRALALSLSRSVRANHYEVILMGAHVFRSLPVLVTQQGAC